MLVDWTIYIPIMFHFPSNNTIMSKITAKMYLAVVTMKKFNF